MISTKEIAWFAGLCEGEASFMFSGSPTVQIQMTDLDVLLKAADMVGVTVRGPYYPKRVNSKPVFGFSISGKRGAGWMMTMYPLMGERRQAKIRDVLAQWHAKPGMPKASRGSRLKALCHPEENRVAYGLCKQCYMERWRAGQKTTRASIAAEA